MVRALEQTVKLPVNANVHGPYAAAIGAAVLGYTRLTKAGPAASVAPLVGAVG